MKTTTQKIKRLVILITFLFLFNNVNAQSYISIYIDEVLPISCHGQGDGAIFATAYPQGSYVYTLDGVTSNTNGDFYPISAGTHTVCAFDGTATECQTIYVAEPDPLDIIFTTDYIVSCQGNDGVLSANITGGTNIFFGYITWWTNALGDTLNDVYANPFALYLDGLSSGSYNVAIEDDNGCYYNETAIIETALPIVVTATYSPIICQGGSTVINLSSTGGVPYSPMTYLINGATVASNYLAGTYTITATDEKNCTGFTVINITEPIEITTTSSITQCDSYTWNGNTYNASGVYTYTSLNAAGCLHTALLILTINNSTTSTSSITQCNSYAWNDNTYNASGVYTHTSLNNQGCTHTETLNLTINYDFASFTTTTQCDAYLWNGTTYTTNGVYTYTSINTGGCINIEALNLTIHYGSSDTINVTACNYYQWTNGVNYTQAGQYTYTYNNAFGCLSTHTMNLILNNGIHISPKVFLYGAYDPSSGLMKDSLRAAVALGDPTGEYSAGIILSPFLIPPHIPTSPTHFLSTGSATINPSVLSISGANAIVDWVLVEIRDGNNYNIVIASQHALLQRDGDVVGLDGVSSLYFPTLCPTNHYISIKHRNHLGVMTAMPILLSASTQIIDFTTGIDGPASTSVWHKTSVANNQRKLVNPGVYALWAGDANNNKNSKFNGSSNDKNAILNAILGVVPIGYPFPPTTNTTYGYRNEDLNMDGKVRYMNNENDRNFLLSMILSASQNSTNNDILYQHTPN